MRQSAVDRAVATLRLHVDLAQVRCIDVGGTKQVWLEIPAPPSPPTPPPSLAQQIRRGLIRRLGGVVPVVQPPTTQVIVTDNPLLGLIPDIQFFDRGFNAEAIATAADVEGDFLLERDVLPLENQFDLVLSFDTLEHVSDPFTFCRNLVRVARPGGHIFLATVFAWAYHPSPEDYFRFSPTGLIESFATSGAEVIASDWDTGQISTYIFLRKPESHG